jgi:excisionase family DNA binding protein
VLKSPYDPDVLYMTVTQAADLLGVNRLTIQRWVKDGRVSGWRVGSAFLVLRADINRESALRREALAHDPIIG